MTDIAAADLRQALELVTCARQEGIPAETTADIVNALREHPSPLAIMAALTNVIVTVAEARAAAVLSSAYQCSVATTRALGGIPLAPADVGMSGDAILAAVGQHLASLL